MKPNSHKIVFERVFFISIIVVLTVFGSVSLLRTMNLGVALQEVRRENEQLMQEKSTLLFTALTPQPPLHGMW